MNRPKLKPGVSYWNFWLQCRKGTVANPARVSPESHDSTHQWRVALEIILDTLRAFPEARKAVHEALRRADEMTAEVRE